MHDSASPFRCRSLSVADLLSPPVLLVAILAIAAPAAAQQPGERPALQVVVEPARATVQAGGTLQFSSTIRGPGGAVPTETPPVVWFAAPFDVAALDETGRLTAFRPGRAQVLAIAGGAVGVAEVEILPEPPASVELVADRAELMPGDVTVLRATPRNGGGEALRDVPVTFRSLDPDVVSVAPGGVVTARRSGIGQVVAEAGDARAELRIEVTSTPIVELSVAPPPSPVRTGDVVRLAAGGIDSMGEAWEDPPVRWSVSGPGADVHPDGAFVAERPGTYVVTASAGQAAATAAVVVTPRTHARRLEVVAHRPFPDLQVAEHWAVGDALYVSTISDRVYTFDISDPGSPVLVDSLVVDAQAVNDVSTTADGRIGVLTREGASTRRNGLVFLDLSEPLRPRVLSEYTETVTGGVHSAFVDGHHVYATDDATGSLRVISFEDPENPREVARWEIEEEAVQPLEIPEMGLTMLGGRYLHDVQVRDGLAYLAYWNHGLVILDVGHGIRGGTPEDPRFVSRYDYDVTGYYPPEYMAGTHAVFRYGDYVFIGDEVFPPIFDLASRERVQTLGRIQVIDVSDLERPVKVAEYDVRDMGSHNFWIEDDVMYVGYYEGGVRAVDVSGELRGDLMAQGREIGAVWTGSSRGFRPNVPMAWGAQPHRGFVYATDINSGVWTLRLTPVPIP